MIQRVQTVYLALVLIFSFVGLMTTMGEWTFNGDVVADFSNFSFNSYGSLNQFQSYGPFCMGILLIVVMFLTLMSIMLFRKRLRQLRLTIISTILMVGYVLSYACFAYKFDLMLQEISPDMELKFHLPFLAVLPILSIFLNVLAIIGIRKDEALVRSLDRLR